jgi:hypothetical protein
MADATFVKDTNLLQTRRVTSWSAIFAGTFVFLAVEATFGLLGLAIFANASNPAAAHPVTGMSAGIGIWTVILTIIALYCGGRAAGHLSGVTDKLNGMYHGLVTFGLSIFATVLITAMILGTNPGTVSSAVNAAPSTIGDVLTTAGYWLFVALLLGGLSAILGGSNAATAAPSAAEIREADRTKLRSIA